MNTPTWISLIPPILVLSTAAITRHVIASLAIGIVAASILFIGFSPLALASHIGHSILAAISITSWQSVFTSSSIHLFAFLACLGTVIELLIHMGGMAACTTLLLKRLTTKRAVETSSLALSHTFFLDDYLNNLVTGSVIRPLTDNFKIPRVKLAFLLDAMSSALGILMPASSWAATIMAQLSASGVSDTPGVKALIAGDPLMVYLQTIPFIFYAFFIIGSAWLVVRCQLSFGKMRQQELIAEETGNLFGGKEPPTAQPQRNDEPGSLTSFFVPVIVFIGSILFFILWTGNNVLLGGSNGFINTLKTASTMVSLLAASICTLVTIALILHAQKRPAVGKTILKASWNGIKLMKNSLIVLLLAFTFGQILNADLHTGDYLGQLISASLPMWLLPLLVFCLASLITASTGSSWGTIAILTPLTITTLASLTPAIPPLDPWHIPAFFATLGGLLAGSVAGAHFSPITDATVVSSMSAGSYHLDHVYTLMGYALPALIGSGAAFLITGLTSHWSLWASYGIAVLVGASITASILLLRSYLAQKRSPRTSK